jgi:hypothetical protein
MRLDGESLRTKTRLESWLPRLCPDAKHAARRKGAPAALDRQTPIEGIVLRVCSRVGTFEEIENDGVESRRPIPGLSDAIRHIADANRDPCIPETIFRQARQGATTPVGDDRVKLCDIDLTLRAE